MGEYVLKHVPSDFKVHEVSILPSTQEGMGIYSYALLEKKNYTTFEAVERLATFFSLNSDEIGHAGLKDEDAITQQYISIRKKLKDSEILAFNEKNDISDEKWVSLTLLGSGSEPVEVANLFGNAFDITIRSLDHSVFEKVQNKTKIFHFINYYGSQRFGLPGEVKNTHCIGEYILKGNFERAIYELGLQNSKEGRSARQYNGDPEFFFSQINKKLVSFFQSAYYSHLWNQSIWEQLSVLDIPCFNEDHLGIMLPWPIDRKDIFKLLELEGATQVNTRVVVKDGQYVKVHYERLKFIQTQFQFYEFSKDDFFDQKYKLRVKFYLPLGTYATIAIHQLMQEFNITDIKATESITC